MAANEAFRGVIARAREAQQDAIIDDTVRMADEATEDNWQVVRLRIWARQWRAGKLAPKKYGDRTTIAGDPNAPLTLSPEVAVVRQALIDRLQRLADPDAVLTIEGSAEPPKSG